jgi:tetratricopeptide (TPR) repeat protein
VPWPRASILRSSVLLGLLLLTTPVRAEGFARYLAGLGLASEAADELDRADLLDPEAGFDTADGPRLGMQLLAHGDSEAAARVLHRAVERTQDLGTLRLSLAVALLQAGSYPQAVQEFGRLEAFAETPALRTLATRFRCIAHLHRADATPARTCALALLGERADPPAFEALSLDPERRSRLGGVLSALVPGLGQASAGEVGDGAGALLVNGAWGYGVVQLLLEHAPVDAALLGLGVGMRYYVGNIQHGAQAWRAEAQRHQREATQRLLQKIADLP